MRTDAMARGHGRETVNIGNPDGDGGRVPSVPGLLVRIALLRAALALVGFARTWAWIGRHATTDAEAARARRHPRRAALETVETLERAVATAAALFPGRAECLERSLLLYWVLRRRGVPVDLRLGVQLYPFLAHAWVEYDGVVVNDVPEHVALFAPMEGATP